MIFTQLVSVAFNHVHLFRRFTKIIFYEEKLFETPFADKILCMTSVQKSITCTDKTRQEVTPLNRTR